VKKSVCVIFLILAQMNSDGLAQDNLRNLNWLQGKWIAEDSSYITMESWRKISEQSMEGSGQIISKATGDTLNRETLRIVEKNDEVFYLAKVNQNQYPVVFKLTETNDSLLVFSNPEHDFPTRIQYNKGMGDKIIVNVSNDKRSFVIIFERMENR
jgi:hypothetical protein